VRSVGDLPPSVMRVHWHLYYVIMSVMETDINPNEVWLPVRGYEGLYEVSNAGRVRSLDRAVKERRTGRTVIRTGKVLKPQLVKGYYSVTLGRRAKLQPYKVHRLVAIHFLGRRHKSKPVTNHINGNKLDNRIENLEWCSIGYNLKHAYKMGYKLPERGSKHYLTTLDEDKVRSIKQLIKDGARNKDIAAAFGIKPGIVSAIKNGLSWRHVKL
jgi:hypothetical protein